jgi:ubiquinone/menaquinone biosynthesis C-methylase UbiE
MQELLLRFLPPAPARICDVGGAAGAYTFWMASHGHKITLIDIVPLHIEQAMQRQKDADPEKRVLALVGDARRLPFPDDSFDALLMHGPMYHLTNKDDRRVALAESYRVLKPNGRLLVVGITRYASAIYGLTSGDIWKKEFYEMVKTGLQSGLHRNAFRAKSGESVDVYFHLPDELKAEVLAVGFDVEKCIGVVGPSWLAQDFASSWRDPAKQSAIVELARLMENEPALGPRVMVVAKRKAL